MRAKDFITENMDHDQDGQAVKELKAALVAKRDQLRSATDKQVYDIIDRIMTRIARSHSISGQKLHDMWVRKYKQVPDTWIMDEDRHPNDPPYGPETKPTMPKGTVRVDVSDVYDWYKLGMHISDLDGLGKHDFGKGPPSTIFSFGSEEQEHKYIKDLEKTGLTTTDIDPLDPNQPKGMPRQKVDPTFNVNEEEFNGIDITMDVEGDEIMVTAMANGRELGHVLFVDEGEYLMPQDLEVDERFQGQGIAAAMYDYVKSKGYKIRRSGQQTDAGAGFWGKHRPEQNVWESTADDINKMFNNMYDPMTTNLQRVALMAMQGRQDEAVMQLNRVIKDASPEAQKKITDAVNNIKPVTVNGKIADSSTLDKSKQHQDWILNTFIPWVQSLLDKQGMTEEQQSTPTMGINVRSDGDIDYAGLIINGRKKYESRQTDSLRPYVGKTVAIVRTGKGPAVAIGQVTVGEPVVVDAEKFDKMRKQHLVPQGSKFDIGTDATKYLYPMINPIRWDREKLVKQKGIVARKIDEGTESTNHVLFLGPDAVIVGQEHGKPLKLSDQEQQKIRDIAERYGAWYEGNGMDQKHTRGIIDDYRGSWDDDLLSPKIKGYPAPFLYVLFSNIKENDTVEGKIGFDPDSTIFDRILDTQPSTNYFPDRQFDAETLQKFLKSVSEGQYDFVQMSQAPATKQNVTKFFTLGERLMFPNNWEEYPYRAGRVAKSVNDLRDRFLASRKQGVYVAGSDHLEAVQQFLDQSINENFADGKVKGKSRPGRVKRSGASCSGSVTDLRRRARNASGERAKMYHWCANMKSGRNK